MRASAYPQVIESMRCANAHANMHIMLNKKAFGINVRAAIPI